MQAPFSRLVIPLIVIFLLPLASFAANFEIRIFNGSGTLVKTVGIEEVTSIDWKTQCYKIDSTIEIPTVGMHGHLEVMFNQAVILKAAFYDFYQSDLPPKKMPIVFTTHWKIAHNKICITGKPGNNTLKKYRDNADVLNFLKELHKIE